MVEMSAAMCGYDFSTTVAIFFSIACVAAAPAAALVDAYSDAAASSTAACREVS